MTWTGSVMFLASLAGLAALGCSSSDSGAASPAATGSSADQLTWTSPSFTVAPGDSFTCFYTDVVTDKELAVLTATGTQGAGGHHISVYYVDNQRPVGSEDCSGTPDMLDWHFVVASGGEGAGAGVIQLPAGLAMQIPAGKQLLVQSHYINTTGAPETVQDGFTINLTDPAKVENYAADFVIDDESFEVPAHGSMQAVSECQAPQDLQLVLLLGHMHQAGKHFKLEQLDGDGGAKTLYEQDWAVSYVSHPPVTHWTVEQPYVVKAGTRFRQTCEWDNAGANPIIFPSEMCISFGYYFPGTSRIECEKVTTP